MITSNGLANVNKTLYLNRDVGFNVQGYNYNQKQLPCDVDNFLVDDIAYRSVDYNLDIKTVGTGDPVPKSDIPVLAIEIDHLALGKKGFNFGKSKNSVLPSMQVTVALIRDEKFGGNILAKHSCAILTLKDVSPATSGILDMGTYGMTVCDATQKCIKDLSKDIVEWVVPKL